MAEATGSPAQTADHAPMHWRSARSLAKFRAAVAAQGGTILEPSWKGGTTPHRVRCPVGHENAPQPNHVIRGKGICRTCAGQDPREAEARFRQIVTTSGGMVLGAWSNNRTPVLVRCVEGHESAPNPGGVLVRGTFCKTCNGRDSAAAWATFRARVESTGGVVIEPRWLGAMEAHRIRCAQGHEGRPAPASLHGGQGICWTCSGTDPHAAETAFRARVSTLGGVLLEPYRSSGHPHRVRCAKGHETTVRPNGLQGGEGLCRYCAGKVWDAFYVVASDLTDVVKFGITSGDPRPRLSLHAREGFEEVLRLHVGLPGDVAPELERNILAALRDAREEPVRGREYFHSRALALVLDLVDNHPAIRAA